MDYKNILWAFVWFAIMGGAFGIILAVASKVFAVKVDERQEKIASILPGANCGGCGYTGCAALAEAIVRGEVPPNKCGVLDEKGLIAVCDIMGIEPGAKTRVRAQVMCSGTSQFAKKKYIYEGAKDCICAAKLDNGDKLCPNGCIGLGTCVKACKFDAIKVVDGVAVVDYNKCTGCGVCVSSCPKRIIKLIPFNSAHWVGCMSVDNGATTRKYCDVGCISCRICEKHCPTNAITVNDFVASIEYDKCIDCGNCVSKCPRKIIWSSKSQGEGLVITWEKLFEYEMSK